MSRHGQGWRMVPFRFASHSIRSLELREQSAKGTIICVCNYRGIGGAQMNASLIATEFARRGYQTQVLFLCEREPDYTPSSDFKVLLNSKKITFWNFPVLFIHLLQIFYKTRPVAIYGFQPAANAFAAVAARISSKAKFIATQRNPSDKQSKLGRFLDRILGSSHFYYANIAVSHSVKNSYAAHGSSYNKKLLTIHNGTPPLSETEINKKDAKRLFGMPSEVLILGVVARLHTQKNIDFAISVLKETQNAMLYIAGDGPEEKKLKDYAKDLNIDTRVVFLGSITGKNLTSFYRAIDIFLLPSIYEGFGRTIVEALSEGLPVIANDIPIAREVAGSAGRYASLDVKLWTDLIQSVHLDHRPGDSIARASMFQVDRMADSYLAAANLSE